MLDGVKLLSSPEASSDDRKQRGRRKSGDSDSGLHSSSVESPLGKEGGGWASRSPRGLQFFL